MASSRTTPALPTRGYQVIYLGLPRKVLDDILQEAQAREYKPVLKEFGGDNDDNFRGQSRVAPRESSPSLNELRSSLRAATASMDPQWKPDMFSYMRSLPGGAEQDAHQDYPASVIRGAARTVPASMVLALQPGTSLRVYEGCFEVRDDSKAREVPIPVGFAIVFRGDLIHDGMSYTTDNYRLHCYLTYAKMNWEPDVVSSVLPRTYTCKFCGLKMLKLSAKDTHQFYCSANPKGAENKLKRKREDLPGDRRVCCECGKAYKDPSSYRSYISRPHRQSRTTRFSRIKRRNR